MKVTKEVTPFSPITITLESEEEAMFLMAKLNNRRLDDSGRALVTSKFAQECIDKDLAYKLFMLIGGLFDYEASQYYRKN